MDSFSFFHWPSQFCASSKIWEVEMGTEVYAFFAVFYKDYQSSPNLDVTALNSLNLHNVS
jgi:hypothetical protein